MSSEGPFFDTISGSIFTTQPISQDTFLPVGQGSGFNNGYVNSALDQDWFRISLRAGETSQSEP
jgi:hypothetical protein